MSTDDRYEKIRLHILGKLKDQLSKDLYYHGMHHTLDVLKEAMRIASAEKINNEEDLFNLKVSCLYHDSGYLQTYKNHEELGCNLAKEELPLLGVSEEQVAIICRLIMATRIPQAPGNLLEQVICDADLDYLGRTDFFSISNSLFLELKQLGLVQNENDWNVIQVNFMKQHNYFTETNKKLRGALKQAHLDTIESMM